MALAGLVLAMAMGACKKKPAPPPPLVLVMTVTPRTVAITDEWIGTLDGFVNAQIRAQVTGYLLTQNYAEGSIVKRGDMMFEIDPRPFQAALDQALAKLAQDQATARLTEINVNRYAPLAKEQAVSRQELDNAVQANEAAIAQIKADEAAIESARINLGFTKIKSPVDGLAGIALGQIGDLVGLSGPLLTTVSQIDPIKVYFQVNEQSYRTFWRQFVTPAGPANSNQTLPLQLVLSDGSVYPEKGRVFFADRQINPTTGTLQIVGLFSNADFILRPGQFGRVRAQTRVETNAIVLPQRAVIEMQDGYQVAIVGPTNAIRIQPVIVGPQVGSEWIIESGLKPGESVVVEGTQKAKEGVVVTPEPFTQ
ncbi:MAG TPA: efflux RND transporter periplasmic adaptor subunit [Candidatus Sulfotelmatobacter sp.]|nr:efflux RND transporter periplasmic adaptor subunit [Candidatus Sulfotelmatobacter sp.]